MNWFILGLMLALILGIYFKITEVYVNKYKTFELQYFFIRTLMMVIGFACFLSLLYTFNTCKNNSLKKNILKKL